MKELPPHDIDAEDSVIGSLIIDGEMIKGLDLKPEHFYAERNRWFYESCLSLYERGISINQVTLAREMDERGKLEDAGGAAYLSHLVSICPTSMDCRYYAEIVKRLATFRYLIAAARQIEKIGHNPGPDAADAVNRADEILLSLRKNGASSPVITPDDRARLMSERYTKLYGEEGGVAVPTGLRVLDFHMGGGLYNGELTILAARPGMGKTTAMMNIANNASVRGNVLVCSAEMPVEGITDRDVAAALGIPISDIRRGGYSDELYSRMLGEGLDVVSARNVYFHFEKDLTTEKIMQAGLNMQLRYGLALVCVDYLGILEDRSEKNPYERMSYISRRSKALARELNVPVLALHQLSRAIESRPEKRPFLSDLRDSGQLEQDADQIIFIYRDDMYFDRDTWEGHHPNDEYPEGIVELIVAKNRQGDTGIARVYYDKAHQQYRDMYKDSGEQLI